MSTLSTLTPPNLTVPSSQNTAAVVKFRCLYTHDLRRKSKRWQDGFLRFHTFNRRVMVYDTPGNFIGDLHWRQDAGIQDGDEFELDKGVMVEVCECMEKTKTDLSKLFESSRGAGGGYGSPRPRPEPEPTQTTAQFDRASPQGSKPARLQPSLSELLGIKRTPTERLVSSNGPRRILVQQNQGDDPVRPAKRQKAHRETKLREPLPRHVSCGRPADSLQESSASLSESILTTGRPSQLLLNSETRLADVQDTARLNPLTKHQLAEDEERSGLPAGAPPTLHAHPTPTPTPLDLPANMLRLSTGKRRSKLIYQAVLQTQATAKVLEPARSRKEPTSAVSAKHESPKTQTGAPGYSIDQNEFIPSTSTQLALDNALCTGVPSGQPVKRNSPLHCPGQGPLTETPKSVKCPPQITSRPTQAVSAYGVSSDQESRSVFPQGGLRKSLSDPTMLAVGVNIQSCRHRAKSALPTLDEDEAGNKGPWTSEALDLFDFWPPGRPKPN